MTIQQLFAGRGFDIEKAQKRLRELFAQEGLPYGERTHTYNSRLAQELAKWAEHQPGGEAIHDALFEAYFVEGTNLARIDSLLVIAERIGLDGKTARKVLENREQKAAVDRDWKRSAELGISGVPTFVINNRGVVGAQPYSALAQLINEALNGGS